MNAALVKEYYVVVIEGKDKKSKDMNDATFEQKTQLRVTNSKLRSTVLLSA